MEDQPSKSSFSDGILDDAEVKPAGRSVPGRADKPARDGKPLTDDGPSPAPGTPSRKASGAAADRPAARGRPRPATPPKKKQAKSARPVRRPAKRSRGTSNESAGAARATKPAEAADSGNGGAASSPRRSRGSRRPQKAGATAVSDGKPAKKMLINIVEPEETRIAILEDGALEELYMERSSSERNVGNIYKGKVSNVEAGIQAAFIDIGLSRNGFLHVSDVIEEASPPAAAKRRDKNSNSDASAAPRGRRPHRAHVPLQQLMSRGDERLVQITRAGLGAKGPSLTTRISLPGRYMVLMPYDRHRGVSRKILDEKVRTRLRQIVDDLVPTCEYGFIVRTAGATVGKRELARDLRYLQRLWKDIEARAEKATAPSVLYTESELVVRCLRDVLASDTGEIIIDSEEEANKVRDFLRRFSRTFQSRLKLYKGSTPLFHRYGLEQQIDRVHDAKIPLNHGGSIVIQQTEAMVAIDVNSGRFVQENDPEETAFKTNLAAAPEIARQLRLRDLGGVIVIDFIDMLQERHKREVEQALSLAMKRDRARTTTLRMSRFCLVQMTRQRVRTSVERAAYQSCPLCSGRGIVKSVESVALDVMRKIKLGLHRERVEQVEAHIHPDVAWHLQNKKRGDLAELESSTRHLITVHGDPEKGLESSEVVCQLDDGQRSRV